MREGRRRGRSETYHRLRKRFNLPAISGTNNLMSPSNSKQPCAWTICDDVLDECYHPVMPALGVQCIGDSSADDDEVVVVIEVGIVSFRGLVETDVCGGGGGLDAGVVASVDLLVKGGVGAEDACDADGEFDHGCGCGGVRVSSGRWDGDRVVTI